LSTFNTEETAMPNVITLDEVAEPVRRFLENLSPSPEGSVVEMSGRRVHLLVRPTEKPEEDGPWTAEKNHRRAALIDKEIDGTITPTEAVELEELTQQMRRHREKGAPLPLEYAHQLLEELTTKFNGGSR
jgi:hypothetical protein